MSPRLHRLRARIILVALSPFTIGLGTAGPAFADTLGGVTAAGVAWLQVTDSHGVPVQAYGLSLDKGSVLNPSPVVDSRMASWLYSLFKAIIDLALWLLDNVLSFSWLRVVSEPLNFVGTQMARFALSPAVIGLFGTIAAVIIGIALARGFLSRAGAQIGTALMLALLAVTLAGRQVAEVLGPTGLLALGRDIAFEFATLFSPGGPRSGIQAVDAATTELADHFARTPTQLWNFGRSLDQLSPTCGRAWSDAIATGPLDKVKDAVQQACPGGQALHDYAMHTAADDSSTGFWAIVFALVVLVVFGYLSYHVVILGLSTLFWAIVTVFAAIAGFIPGPAQTLAVKAVLDALLSWLGMIAYVAAVCITGSLASTIFTTAGDQVAALPLTSLLLVALLVAVRKINKKLADWREASGHKAAQIGANAGHTVPADLANMLSELSRPTYRPGTHINRLDPLTAVPAAGQRLRRITTTGINKAKTATITATNPTAGTAASAAAKAKAVAAKPQTPTATTTTRRAAARTGPGTPTATLTWPTAPTSPRRTRAAAASLADPAATPAQPGPPTATGGARQASAAPTRPRSPKSGRRRQSAPRNATAHLTAVDPPPPSPPAAQPAAAAPARPARRATAASSTATPSPQSAPPAGQRPPGSLHPALREALRDADNPRPDSQP